MIVTGHYNRFQCIVTLLLWAKIYSYTNITNVSRNSILQSPNLPHPLVQVPVIYLSLTLHLRHNPPIPLLLLHCHLSPSLSHSGEVPVRL